MKLLRDVPGNLCVRVAPCAGAGIETVLDAWIPDANMRVAPCAGAGIETPALYTPYAGSSPSPPARGRELKRGYLLFLLRTF